MSNLVDVEQGEKEQQEREDEGDYPPLKVVLPTMAAIYLSVFLIALVWECKSL